MTDKIVLPTTFVYGTHSINQVPVGLSGLMAKHPIALNAAFANAHKPKVISPTSMAGVSQAMFIQQAHGADNDSNTIVSSPLNNNNTGTIEWKQATGQKRQRRGSVSENMHVS